MLGCYRLTVTAQPSGTTLVKDIQAAGYNGVHMVNDLNTNTSFYHMIQTM